MDIFSAFSVIFSLLGAKLLFWSNTVVTFGSVLLTALVSISAANLIATTDTSVTTAEGIFNKTTAFACGFRESIAPLRFACALLQDDDGGGGGGGLGRFSEL